MGKVRRLSNRELRAAIKRNELEEVLDGTGEWIKSHLENVLIGVVLVVVGVVLVPYWMGSRAEQASQAATQLRAAQQEYQRAFAAAGGQAEALNQARSKFQAVSSSFPGSIAAAQAALGVAQVDLALGQWDQALANFQNFLVEFGEDHELAPLAVEGKAQSYEGRGEYEQAASEYLSLDGRDLQAPNLGLSLLGAARCLVRAGKPAEAKSLLERAQKDKEALGLNDRLLALASAGLK